MGYEERTDTMTQERNFWMFLAYRLLKNREDTYGMANTLDWLIDIGYTREELTTTIGYVECMVDDAFARAQS